MTNMKKTGLFVLALLLLLSPACTKRTVDDTPLTAPKSIVLPRDAYPLDLGTGQPLTLEWDYSLGGNVRYQVVFDKETGDFTTPIYAILSDNGGFLPSVTISAAMLKSVARLAGCEVGKSVTVRWTVRTFKGLEYVTGVQDGGPRTLILTLPFEVDPLPLTVTLSGTAVESGSREMEHNLAVSTDASVVISERSTTVFASFLRMADGTLQLTDEHQRKFRLTNEGKVAALEGDAAPVSPVSAGLVYMTVDFEKLVWKAVPITNIWFWNRPWDVGGAYQSQMSYEGNAVWKVTVNPFKIALESHTGYDSRYHFRIDYNGADTDRIGPGKKDVNVSEIGSEGYYNAYRYSDAYSFAGGDQWAYSWKTPENDEWNNHSVTVTLTMRGETYTHSITLNN